MKKYKLKKLLCGMCFVIFWGGSWQTVPVMADILPQSSTEIITEESLAGLSDWELRAARYEITARHGKEVYSQDMKEYFESQDWYQPSEEYDASELSDIEQANIDTLHACELARKQAAATAQFEENQRISSQGDVQVMSSSWVYMESPLYAEDLAGKWVYEPDPYYPHIFEVYEEDGNLYYEYYIISPGNSNGIGIAKEYTKWGQWHGLLKLNEENGWIDCYNDEQEDSGIFRSLQYDVMSDTIVETSMDEYREQFSRNDGYEYQLPDSIDDVVH